jgi:general secretion pathway protein C
MFARLSAFVIWSLVAAAVVFWALRFGVSPPQAPAYAVPIDRAAPPRGDLARLFAAPPVVAVAEEARPEAPSRFRLVGVMAPRSSTPEGTGAYGLALIAVDGKPPRAFAVGSKLDTDLILQSVGLRTASLGSAQGARSVLSSCRRCLRQPRVPAGARLRCRPRRRWHRRRCVRVPCRHRSRRPRPWPRRWRRLRPR